eukprot:SAG22_NODE_5630_length_980_cov_1.377980_3_plen_122_part_01
MLDWPLQRNTCPSSGTGKAPEPEPPLPSEMWMAAGTLDAGCGGRQIRHSPPPAAAVVLPAHRAVVLPVHQPGLDPDLTSRVGLGGHLDCHLRAGPGSAPEAGPLGLRLQHHVVLKVLGQRQA